MRGITELIKKCGASALDWSLRFRCFQDYVNTHYSCPNLVELPHLKGSYFMYDNLKFKFSYTLSSIGEVLTDYRFGDIASSDIVLDIGANIGAFSLFASKKCKHVFAVEPLYANELRANIALNSINNVSILEYGLGVGESAYIQFGREKGKVNLLSLSEILSKIGKCDFLKIDCEGCEWDIVPSELEKFRRIEGELHNVDGSHSFIAFEKMLIDIGFECVLEKNKSRTCLIHAKKEK